MSQLPPPMPPPTPQYTEDIPKFKMYESQSIDEAKSASVYHTQEKLKDIKNQYPATDADYTKKTFLVYRDKNALGQPKFFCFGREKINTKAIGPKYIDGIFPNSEIVTITRGNFPKDKIYEINGIKVRVDDYALENYGCQNFVKDRCIFAISLVSEGGRRRGNKRRRETKRRHRAKRSTRRR